MEIVLAILAGIVLVMAVLALISARGLDLLAWLAIYLVLPRIVAILEAAF